MKKIIVTTILAFVCAIFLYGGNLYEIKGKTVVFMEVQRSRYTENYQPAIYTSAALKSFKFKAEYISNRNLFNIPYYIEDIIDNFSTEMFCR